MADQVLRQLVFAGLGNPGAEYEMTRHNMGAIVVRGFAHVYGISLKLEKRFFAQAAKKDVKGTLVHLLLPTTYMNESGVAVRKYLDYFKLTHRNVVVVSDDADLPFGELKLKAQGSSGGHNGLKSIEKYLGTQSYARLKVGIGRGKGVGSGIRSHVLDRFTKKEDDELPLIVDAAVSALQMLVTEPIETVMNVVNMRKKEKQSEGEIEKP